jgi:hypothetical protein
MNSIKIFLAVFLISFFAKSASAQIFGQPFWDSRGQAVQSCDFCLCSQGISPLEAGSSGIRVDSRYLQDGTVYLNGSKVANASKQFETYFTQQFSFLYAASPSLTISAIVPVPSKHTQSYDDDGNYVTGNSFGLGDISLLARYKLIANHELTTTTIVSINGGIKFPTGSTNAKDSQGNVLDPDIQLGTGSTDFLIGTSGLVSLDRVAVIGNLTASITGKGANGHTYGNSLNYDLGVRYRVYPNGGGLPAAFVKIGINGEYRGHEIQDGAVIDDSGGNTTYFSPGLQVFILPSISVDLNYQYPFIHGLHGEQLGEDYRFTTGVQFLL